MLKKMKSWAKKIKSNIIALYLVLKRKDVPWYKKAYIGLIVGYAVSPIDLIPDFIPVFGFLDDVIILPLGIYFAIKMIPKEIMEACRKEAEEQYGGTKLKSKIAGIVIITFWVLAAAMIGFFVYRHFTSK